MADQRSEILNKINALNENNNADAKAWLKASVVGPLPHLANNKSKLQQFSDKISISTVKVSPVMPLSQVPEYIVELLKPQAGANAPIEIIAGQDSRLSAINWSSQAQLSVIHNQSVGEYKVGMSYASAAIAETGSVVLPSGVDNPNLINFLTDIHIVLLDQSAIVNHIEEIWGQFRDNMPRSLNVISGPSMTGDIELTLEIGAHGPRELHLVIIDR